MPLCNQSLLPIVQEHLHDLPYEEKARIYDERCNGCGFAQIIISNESSNTKSIITNRIEEAVHLARMSECTLERTCAYPPDMHEVFGKMIPVSLTEIVTNTCVFWNTKKEDCYSREETEFIEVETVEEMDVRTESRNMEISAKL